MQNNKFIDDNTFLDAYKKAKSNPELAKMLGLSEMTTRRRIDKMGIPRLYGTWGVSNSKISDEYFKEVCEKAISMRSAAETLNLPMTTFKRRAEKLGCYKTNQAGKGVHKEYVSKYSVNENYFRKFNPQMAYWVGFLVADGSILSFRPHSFRLRLGIEDERHLKTFIDDVDSNSPIHYGKTDSGNGNIKEFCETVINNEQFCRDLAYCGILPKKSQIHGIEYVNLVPTFYRPYFVIGLFDGDGTVTKDDGEISVAGDLTNCKTAFESLGFKSTNFRIKDKGNFIALDLRTRRDAVKFYKVYLEFSKYIHVLQRKKERIEYFYKKYDYIVKDIDEKGDWLKFD